MLESLLYALVYTLTGIAMLGVGYVVLDLLTPGRLVRHIWDEGSLNAAIVLTAGFLGIAAIVFTAIWTNGDATFGDAFTYTVVFGLVGVALQALAFVGLDLVTPGKLGDVVCMVRFHPSSLVTGASLLAVSAIIVASIA